MSSATINQIGIELISQVGQEPCCQKFASNRIVDDFSKFLRNRPWPLQPPAARPNQLSSPPRPNELGTAVPAAGLTADEEARAADLEARILAEEDAAERGRQGSRGRAEEAEDRRAVTRERSRGGLAVRYADEYAYVARDLRRIAVVAVILVVILFGLFALQLAGILTV